MPLAHCTPGWGDRTRPAPSLSDAAATREGGKEVERGGNLKKGGREGRRERGKEGEREGGKEGGRVRLRGGG